MEEVKAFFGRLGKAALNLWNGFKALPIVKPLFALAYSRKSMISLALVGFMVEAFPKLSPVKDELLIVAAQVVVIVFVAVGQSLGIAIEDAAEKGANPAPGG